MKPIDPAAISRSRIASGVLFFAVLTAAAVVRCYGLAGIGIGGSDTILYFTLAEYWLAGDIVFQISNSALVFRPVYLAFNALSLMLFGPHDYALKLGGVVVDILNIALVARLAYLVAGRASVALLTACSYAFLPLAVWAARQELPHTLSTFLVLCAAIFYLRGTSQRDSMEHSPFYLPLAGVFFGLSALTHEELVFLLIPACLCLVAFMRGSGAKVIFARLLSFGVVPLITSFAVYLSHDEAVHRLFLTAAQQPDALIQYAERASRFLWNAVSGSSSALVTALYLGSILFWLYLSFSRRWRNDPGSVGAFGFCVMLPLAFVLLNAVFFDTIFSRAFLPLMPFVLTAVLTALAMLAGRLPAMGIGASLALLTAVATVANLASYSAFAVGNRRYATDWADPVWPSAKNLKAGWREFLVDARYTESYATHWGAIFDVLEGRVDQRHRVLVLPSTTLFSPGRRPLQTAAYFGDNAVYRLDHPQMSIEALVQKYDIAWVVFTLAQQRHLLTYGPRYLYEHNWSEPQALDVAKTYGLKSFSVEDEFHILGQLLHEFRAIEITPFEPGSVHANFARIWRIPKDE